ncbi:MAG: Cytosine-specific methyltransferase [Candidatus Woesebacteria bacterium GW2011_GWA2_44_33]|uniref:Cytosine-specific methyltransferase n=1 Tax=Candidatus Woesebacteria bacterium GW2011_GWA2_44_33 TaxID=1618564 RepID=A0A0G1M2S8_9BACT|nr:MAG: Cytosine-specific methyltransferase [Candidatus Nomurabacteria bacterium GW2011_GWB1_43_19]KKT66229.1 MAG: Cytosine-specific methyltransferase [Candidatus Woesebacteria bacterium GW2011_GWA2_44_33]
MWLKDNKQNSRNFSQGQRVYSSDGIASTIAGNAGGLGGKTGLYAIPVLTPDRMEKRQNGRRFKNDGDPAFTLTSQDKHGVYDGLSIRRLTPVECERLQGFPDNWTEGISDTQRYKCLGNAVTTLVIAEIGRKLIQTKEVNQI